MNFCYIKMLYFVLFCSLWYWNKCTNHRYCMVFDKKKEADRISVTTTKKINKQFNISISPSPTQTKVFHDMKYFYRLLGAAKFRVFRYDQIYINISMNKVTIDRSSNRPFDTHETMFLGPLEHSIVLQVLGMTRVLNIGFNPAYILTAAETPLLEAFSAHV